MRRSIQINLVFLVLLFTACKSELMLPEITVESRIVVNSAPKMGKDWKVYVGKEGSITDTAKIKILDNAKVLLTDLKLSTTEELVHQDNGKYISSVNSKVKEGTNYSLTVSAEGLSDVKAMTYVPSQPNFEVIDPKLTDLASGEGIEFKLQLADKLDERNFYVIQSRSFIKDEEIELTQSNLLGFVEPNTSSDECTPDVISIFIPDDVFNGERLSLKLKVDLFLTSIPQDGSVTTEVIVKAVDEAFYNYLLSVDEFKENEDNPFSEPIRVYSNVEDGLGIFGGISEKIVAIEL